MLTHLVPRAIDWQPNGVIESCKRDGGHISTSRAEDVAIMKPGPTWWIRSPSGGPGALVKHA
jgi:hypothetical protein